MHLNAIYSSISGNTKYVLWQCQHYLESQWHTVQIRHCSMCDVSHMTESDFTILACPTYGHGQYDAIFAEYLMQCQSCNLWGKKYSIISLWDDRYEPGYLCETGPLLSQWVVQHHGIIHGDILCIIRSPYLVHNQTFINKWCIKTFETYTTK